MACGARITKGKSPLFSQGPLPQGQEQTVIRNTIGTYVHIHYTIHTKQGLHLCCMQKYKIEIEQIWQEWAFVLKFLDIFTFKENTLFIEQSMYYISFRATFCLFFTLCDSIMDMAETLARPLTNVHNTVIPRNILIMSFMHLNFFSP